MKKRFLAVAVAVFGIVNFNLFTQEAFGKMNKKALIVYYSYSGNTKELAQEIQKQTGGDIFEIQTVKAYPSGYNETVEQAKKEIERGYKPELKSKVKNIENYDVIFIGSPNWWSTIAPPVAAFLSNYDLSGKTIIPFITHGSGGMARCETDIKKLAPKSNVLSGIALSGTSVKNSNDKIAEWLKKVNK
jgi:flavodoxin